MVAPRLASAAGLLVARLRLAPGSPLSAALARRSWSPVHGEAAGYADHLPRHVGGVVGEQERHDAWDVLGLGDPFEGDGFLQAFVDAAARFALVQERLENGCVRGTWAHRVHVDLEGRQL